MKGLVIRSPLETRKIRIHTMLFPEPKVRQRKFKCAKILSKISGENYSLSEVADVVPVLCLGVVKQSHLHRAYLMSFLAFFILPSKLA